jgi:hypothetical protein
MLLGSGGNHPSRTRGRRELDKSYIRARRELNKRASPDHRACKWLPVGLRVAPDRAGTLDHSEER